MTDGTTEIGENACAVSPSSDTRLSDTLDVLSSGCAGERISFHDLTGVLGDKCYSGMLFLLASPNLLPLPPLADVVLAVPLALVALQLAIGLRRPWLPGFILRRSVPTDGFAKISKRLEPWTRRAENLLQRRLDFLTGLAGRRIIGLVCFGLAVVIALPIPLGNVPPAAALSILALGLMSRDGFAVLAGLAATVAVAIFLTALSYGVLEIGQTLMRVLSL
jgi:hypothetical protein